MKKLGIGLILLAIVILVFNFAYQNILEENNINDVNNYIEDTKIQDEVENKEGIEPEVKEEEKANYQINYTAVLEIPSINLKRGVVDSTKNFNSINYAISVDNSSQYPNELGNFILYSHSGNSNIAFFNKLNKLEINDDIYVYYNGVKYHYSIRNKYDIEKTGKAKVISRKDDKYITLITCNQNKKGFQIVIEGKLIDEINY